METGAVHQLTLPPAPSRRAVVDESSMSWGHCGIHAIGLNPSGDLLACGGTDPSDAVVFSVPADSDSESPKEYRAVQQCVVRMFRGSAICHCAVRIDFRCGMRSMFQRSHVPIHTRTGSPGLALWPSLGHGPPPRHRLA